MPKIDVHRSSRLESEPDRAKNQGGTATRSRLWILTWVVMGFSGFAANVGGLVQH